MERQRTSIQIAIWTKIAYLLIKSKRTLTAIITHPEAENCSPAISISTVVPAPTAGCETQARKWRTTSSYNLWIHQIISNVNKLPKILYQ